jgi:hypothetical protein
MVERGGRGQIGQDEQLRRPFMRHALFPYPFSMLSPKENLMCAYSSNTTYHPSPITPYRYDHGRADRVTLTSPPAPYNAPRRPLQGSKAHQGPQEQRIAATSSSPRLSIPSRCWLRCLAGVQTGAEKPQPTSPATACLVQGSPCVRWMLDRDYRLLRSRLSEAIEIIERVKRRFGGRIPRFPSLPLLQKQGGASNHVECLPLPVPFSLQHLLRNISIHLGPNP